MGWILPLALAGCYAFYLRDIPWRRESKAWKLVSFCLLTAALWAFHRLRDPIPWFLETPLSYGILFLYLWLARKLRAADSFYHVVILFLSTDCILLGTGHMSMVLWGEDYLYDMAHPGPHLLTVLGMTALILVILYPVRKVVFREKRPSVSLGQVFLMILTLLPILYLTNIHQWLGIEPFLVGLHASVIRIVLSLCGLVTILGNESMYRSRLQAQEIKSMEAMLRSQSQQYLMKKESSEAIMQSCHDLKNQLYALRRSPGSEAREEYLAQLQKTIDRYDSFYQTGNETLDIILSEKGLRCREKGIDLVCVIQGELLSFLNPTDICTIFGNALDNAIEGLAEVTDPEKRIIQVKAARENGFLIIRFENPYAHSLNRTEAGFDTTKADRLGHGYGLKGIRYTVEKYQGHLVIDTDEGKFILTLLLSSPPAPGGTEGDG